MGNSCAHAKCGTVWLKAHGGSHLCLGESWLGGLADGLPPDI